MQKNLVFVIGLSPRLADPEVRNEIHIHVHVHVHVHVHCTCMSIKSHYTVTVITQ